MNHSFSVEVAGEVGVVPAILLENIAHWVRHSRSNNKNFFDGDYWTFSSVSAWCDLFPYLTENQIRRGLEKLFDSGFIKTGNYNKSAYDRTKWYALTKKSWFFYGDSVRKEPEENARNSKIREVEKAKSNCQTVQIHSANLPNGKGENDRPIPYINTDIGTDIDKDTTTDVVVVANDVDDAPAAATKSSKKPACPHQDIINLYHEILPMCPRIKAWTPARASALRARWNEEKKRQNLDYWRAFFEYVASCDFLTGKVSGSRGRPFIASLDWMLKAENFTKIREERYDNDR